MAGPNNHSRRRKQRPVRWINAGKNAHYKFSDSVLRPDARHMESTAAYEYQTDQSVLQPVAHSALPQCNGIPMRMVLQKGCPLPKAVDTIGNMHLGKAV